MALLENDVLFHIKFIPLRFVNQFLKGDLSFSCPGYYIEEAEKGGNNKQGDCLEAVFAHLHSDNPKITEMRNLLGTDLEEIQDGCFTFLRRKSAKLIPVFCTYGYSVSRVYRDGYCFDSGRHNICFRPDEKMYTGFSEISLLIKCSTFYEKIDKAACIEHLDLIRRNVEYKDFSQEFFLMPTDDYSELFVKSKDYMYQEEYRISLVKESLPSINERRSLFVEQFVVDDEVYVNKAHMQYDFSLMFGEHGKVISI